MQKKQKINRPTAYRLLSVYVCCCMLLQNISYSRFSLSAQRFSRFIYTTHIVCMKEGTHWIGCDVTNQSKSDNYNTYNMISHMVRLRCRRHFFLVCVLVLVLVICIFGSMQIVKLTKFMENRLGICCFCDYFFELEKMNGFFSVAYMQFMCSFY